MRALLRTRRRKIMLAAALALVAAGGAIAAWTIISTGTGAGKVGSLIAPTVSPGTPVGDLVPSSSFTGSLAFTVANPNGPLVITDVDTSIGAVTVTSGTCSTTLFSGHPVSGLSIAVPAGSSNIVVPNLIKLDPSAPSTCQGAEFTKAGAQVYFGTP